MSQLQSVPTLFICICGSCCDLWTWQVLYIKDMIQVTIKNLNSSPSYFYVKLTSILESFWRMASYNYRGGFNYFMWGIFSYQLMQFNPWCTQSSPSCVFAINIGNLSWISRKKSCKETSKFIKKILFYFAKDVKKM